MRAESRGDLFMQCAATRGELTRGTARARAAGSAAPAGANAAAGALPAAAQQAAKSAIECICFAVSGGRLNLWAHHRDTINYDLAFKVQVKVIICNFGSNFLHFDQ